MNYQKFYLALIKLSDRQQGFTMPLALGLGLAMIIIAASLIARSQTDRLTTTSQRESNRAISIAEAGIVRSRAWLDRYRFLATKNLNTWNNTIDGLDPTQSSCNLINLSIVRQQVSLLQANSWIDLDSSDPHKGRYRIVDYQYQNGSGKLTVTGAISTAGDRQNFSNATISVNLPIGSEAVEIAPPAVWAKTFALGADRGVTGDIRATNCPQITTTDSDGVVGVDASNIASVNSLPSGEIVADPFTPMPSAKVAPNQAIAIPAITNSIEFPRPSSIDLPGADGEYHYLIDIDNSTSNHSIKLLDGSTIKLNIPADRKVNLYLKGNIDLADVQTINVDPQHPNLRIYGTNQTTTLTIKNSAAITAFIHAPFADAQTMPATTPNPNSNLTGAVWVKSWNSAASNSHLPIVRSGTWADFGIPKAAQPSHIGAIGAWQREMQN
jgi:Tfp pilus assembly protein PilX